MKRIATRIFTVLRNVPRFTSLLLALLMFPGVARTQQLTPAWVELGDNGAAIARVIVTSRTDCPSLQIDGTPHAMALREPTPRGFRPLCELPLPAGAKSASLGAQKLVLPRPNPSRIAALGDTGCRIKGGAVQNCNDAALWPFKQIASQASTEKPELVIHVGDYLYRESPCPAGSNAMCGGTPAGDNWDAWNADFFAPAAKLLASAPWAFVRGNHEDCLRAWRGFFYYLDPHPWTGICQKYAPPYVIKLGAFQLAMIDSSAVREDAMDEAQISQFAAELSSLHVEHAWLADHHPFWGFKSNDAGGAPIPLSIPLEQAWTRGSPAGFSLVLSGHIHLFEFVNFDRTRPGQIVLGDGGTDMSSPIPPMIKNFPFPGATSPWTESERQFGYTLFTKRGAAWEFTLKNRFGQPLVSCQTSAAATCKTFPDD